MNNIRDYLKLYFIMGSNNCPADPLKVLEQALQGGITLFQFREKGKGAKQGREKYVLAQKMKDLCDQYKVPFFVNDDVDLAIEVKAAGIHVGQEDEPIKKARERCPSDFIIGVSATNQKEAIQALADGADYIGAGPIFSTNTKEDAKTPIGIAGITEIRRLTGNIPLVAIGGINKENTGPIIQAGADGVSLITAISQAENPKLAAADLKQIVNSYASF